MFQRDAAEGIHRLSHAHVNCYLVEGAKGITLVDAGVPAMWKMVLEALKELGREPADIRALAITHPHFDHMGFAAQVQQDLRVPVLVHESDGFLAAHPYRYRHEKMRLFYPFRYPKALPVLGRLWAAGLRIKGIQEFQPLAPGSMSTMPGNPRVIHTPGHTNGHCVLHFPARSAVITGDALVTQDPYTGRTGPRIVAAGSTYDTAQALSSLTLIAETGAATVLPGHGEPWTGGAAEAVRLAREQGAI
jgi:glyoxylase-like metal-dependent hydrolase (beta-lactamase superfamily II)